MTIKLDDYIAGILDAEESNAALLEALKIVLDDLVYSEHSRVIDFALAAIKTAKGESP